MGVRLLLGGVGFAVPVAAVVGLLGEAAVPASRKVRIPAVTRFAVRVDPATGVDRSEAERVVLETLLDPRSWGFSKHTRFVLTTWKNARLRISIQTPRQTDRSCAPFRTERERSCSIFWSVFINSDRWSLGAEPSKMNLDEYRRYVVNHEVGHSLGEDHVPCPGPGLLAPVMLQQTIGLDGCLPNPWPHPGRARLTTTTSTTSTTSTVPTVPTVLSSSTGK